MATPPPPFSRWALVEQRLLYLEQREDANTRDILKLKSDNASLLSSNLELKQQNAEVGKEKKLAEDRLSKLEKETKNSISQLMSEVSILRGLQRVLNPLLIKGHEEAMKEELQALQKKVSNIDDKTKAANNRIETVEYNMVGLSNNVKSMEDKADRRITTMGDKLDTMSDRVDATNVKLGFVDNDVTEMATAMKTEREQVKIQEGGLTKLEGDVKTLDVKSEELTKDLYMQKTAAMWANIKPSMPLVNGTEFKLDCCCNANTLGSNFKKDICEYHCPVTGIYGVSARLVHTGEGRIKVKLYDGEALRSSGWTNEEKECLSFVVCGSNKGDKWTVRIVKEGEAEFQFCQFSCFLLSPL